MKPAILYSGAAFLLLACSLAGAAQTAGYWRAASNTARSITSDIAISDSKLTINFTAFPLSQIRSLKPAEVSAVFDADVNAGGTGTLYRLAVPAAKRFIHHNTLCGTEDTQWMATYVSGKTMQVAFFSGANAPEFTIDALANSPDLCGTYTYIR
jgi:hypothetical protein